MTAAVSNRSSYELARTMQRLWADHAMWARQYIIAAVDERPEAPEAAARWLRVGDDIGRELEQHYPRRTARRVAKLLRQHVMVAVDLIDAARNVDKVKCMDIDDVWWNNGEDLVDELCARNEAWSRAELLAQWDAMRQQTKDVLAARLEQNFDKDVDAFDQMLTTTTNFADTIADGILRQFADKFAAAESGRRRKSA
jgi:hypothetical protein